MLTAFLYAFASLNSFMIIYYYTISFTQVLYVFLEVDIVFFWEFELFVYNFFS
jgi:hypothetical protein